jgi:hypothetical protein
MIAARVRSDSATHAACANRYYTPDEPKRRVKTLSFCDNPIVFCTAASIRAGEPGWIVLHKVAPRCGDNPTEDADDTQGQETPRPLQESVLKADKERNVIHLE